jgi:hypothetical protein
METLLYRQVSLFMKFILAEAFQVIVYLNQSVILPL